MALTFTSTIDKSIRTEKGTDGFVFTMVEMTTSTGAGGADYSSGFLVDATKCGFNKIYTVIPLSAKNAAGTTMSNKLWLTYDSVALKIRAWVGFAVSGAATTTLTEESGTNLDAGATVRFLVIGC